MANCPNTRQIMVASILFGFVFWIFDAVFDYFFYYDDTLLNLLILNIPQHEIYIRIFVLGVFIIFGLVISKLLKERQKFEDHYMQLAAIVENSHDGIIGKDLTGKIISWNKGAERIYGYSAAEMIGESISTLMPVNAPDDFSQILENIRAGQYLDHYDTIRRRKDDQLIDVSLRVSPIKDKMGNIIGASTIVRDITEQKRIKEALIESEKKFKLISEQSLMAFSIVQDDIFKYANQAFIELTGYSSDEVMSWTTEQSFRTIHPEDREVVEHLHQQRLLGKTETSQYTIRIMNKLGEMRHVMINIVPVEWEKRPAFLILVLDITEQMEIHQQLRESEEKFRLISEQSLMAVVIFQDGLIRYANRAFLLMSEYPLEDIKQWQPYEFAKLIHPEDRDFVMEQARRKQAGKGSMVAHYSYRGITKNGEIKWVDQYSRTIVYEGRTANLMTLVDITDRKQAEKELAAEKEMLAVTLKSIGDAVITTTVDGKIMLLNTIAEKLTGWSQREAEGKDLSDVFHIINEETRLRVESPVSKVLKQGLIIGLANHTLLLAKDGKEIPISDSGAPIRDEEGNIIGVVLVFRDVSEARKLRLAKANFLNAITHELRTPLTPIMGYSQMLVDMDISDEAKSMIDRIMASAKREEKLIDELLTIARLDTGTEKYSFVEVNAYEFLNSIYQQTRILAKHIVQERYDTDQFEYTSSISKDLDFVTINIDNERMYQVIENLITNAIKYSPCHRLSIQFLAEVTDNRVMISIEDKGYGIPKEEQDRVFESFYQIRRNELDVSDGIGQGLVIVKRYVEAHGGSIDLQSEVDRGSVFTIRLPIINDRKEELAIKNVLLIEDDDDNVDFISVLLRTNDYEVIVARTGEEGMSLLQGDLLPDLVVLDLQLPDIDGEDIIKFVESTYPSLPIFLCSAQPEEKLQLLHQNMPAVRGYISKPFNITQFISTIQELGG